MTLDGHWTATRQVASAAGRAVDRLKHATICTAIVFLAVGAMIHPASGAWSLPVTVGDGVPAGHGLAVVTQSPGRVHVSYQDSANDKLMYATNAYGAWETAVIDAEGSVGSQSAIAVDSAGGIHVSYYSSYQHSINYATDVTGSWQVQGLPVGEASECSSIAVDDGDNVHIAFAAGSPGQLQYASNAGGNWVVSAIKDASDTALRADDVGAILISSSGNVHIIYACGGLPYHATNASGQWVAQEIDSGATVKEHVPPVAVLDGTDKIHVAYLDISNPLDGQLKYATNTTTPWTVTCIDNVGAATGYSACIAAKDNALAILYYDAAAAGINRATKNGVDPWQKIETSCDLADTVGYSAGTVDENGSGYFAYFTAAGELRFVTDDTVGPTGADVAVKMDVSNTNVNGWDVVTFTATVTNRGPEQATGVRLLNPIPDGATVVGVSGGTYIPADNKVVWEIGTLDAGASVQMVLQLKMPPDGGTITNTSSIAYMTEGQATADFKKVNNLASGTVQVTPLPPVGLILSVGGGVGGDLVAQNPQVNYEPGSMVTVVATPDPGWQVKGWSGTTNDASTSTMNTVLIGAEDTAVEVTFEKLPPVQRTLVASVAGGQGSVTPTGGTYDDGTTVTLTAKPDRHWRVRKWTGTNDDSSTDTVNGVTMNANRTVFVEFEARPNEYPHANAAVEPSSVGSGQTVTLDGSNSSDPEGGPLTYSWKQVGGPDVTLSDPSAVKPTFAAPSVTEVTTVAFELTVMDDLGLEDKAPVEVHVSEGELPPCTGACCKSVGAGNLIAFYSLCWLGMIYMKWGGRISRKR